VAFGESITRGGIHYRIALPHWADALDTGHSKSVGGRWNEAGSFGALYLNDSAALVRLHANQKLAGLPYGIEDLDPPEQHDLVVVDVPQLDVLDCVTDGGLHAVGLPESYPRDGAGNDVTWNTCQPIGEAAHADAQGGIACRSAAATASRTDEELVVFDTHSGGVIQKDRVGFEDWYWG
jgi:RES domain-containing protein